MWSMVIQMRNSILHSLFRNVWRRVDECNCHANRELWCSTMHMDTLGWRTKNTLVFDNGNPTLVAIKKHESCNYVPSQYLDPWTSSSSWARVGLSSDTGYFQPQPCRNQELCVHSRLSANVAIDIVALYCLLILITTIVISTVLKRTLFFLNFNGNTLFW